eukprot:jgi/Chrzof1/2171/Cz11g04260.t1
MLRLLNGSSMQSARVSQRVFYSTSIDVTSPRLKQIQSPPSVIAEKSRELQNIAPGGLSGWIKNHAVALPLWIASLLQIGVTVLKR